MENIFDKFSCASWLLIHQNKFDEFIKQFNLELLASCNNFDETVKISTENEPINLSTFRFYEVGRLIITSPIKEYRIIFGKSVDYLFDNFCKCLSKNAEVYRFSIDIWIPAMLFEYYKNEQLIRHCEYDVNNNLEFIDINSIGEELEFEDEELDLPDIDYGCFYYPLAIMNYLGISNEDIANNLNNRCWVYKLDNKLIVKIKSQDLQH